MANSEREKEEIKTPASLGLRKTYRVKARLDEGCSWTACVIGFIVMFIIGGQNNSSGIIFAVLLDEFNTNRGQTGKIALLFFFWFDNISLLSDKAYNCLYALVN